ncbi:hypothetical protein BAE44_0008772 [Dichanthelium oligosanthes]|uniref:Uncharacterized protein n=1 Tax=Dichanthelium oligosanthes TaxID=888268 RepID=A0A1E5VYK4_9POAL|nr:hypothetical protein BAE44_0008772 [Dichanthelium oligosanthes]
MAGDAAAAAGTGAAKKPPREEEDDDELDDVPLAISRTKKAGNASASKAKEEEDDDEDEEDNLPLSRSRTKKVCLPSVHPDLILRPVAFSQLILSTSFVNTENLWNAEFKLCQRGNEKQKGTVKSNTKASKAKKEVESDDDDFMVAIFTSLLFPAIFPLVLVLRLTIMHLSLSANFTEEKGRLMEWGLLPLDVARKVFEKKQGQKLKSPVKTIVSKRKPTSPTKTPASSAMKSVSAAKSAGKPTSQKKRKASSESDDDDDDDFMAPKAKTKRLNS